MTPIKGVEFRQVSTLFFYLLTLYYILYYIIDMKIISLRLSEETIQKIDKVASFEKTTRSKFIRRLINNEFYNLEKYRWLKK